MNARLTPLVVVGERISSSSVRWEGPKLSRLRIQPSPRILTYSSFFLNTVHTFIDEGALCVSGESFPIHSWPTRVLDVERLIRKRRMAQACVSGCVYVCSVAKFPVSLYHPLISITNALEAIFFPLFLCGSAWLCHFEGVRWSIRV